MTRRTVKADAVVRAARRSVPGLLLVAALAALMLVPGVEDYAWLVVVLIIASSATLLALAGRARRGGSLSSGPDSAHTRTTVTRTMY